MEEEQSFYKQRHDINIALVAQMELSNILKSITMLDMNYPIDSPQKQKQKLELIIHYLTRATPYLSKKDSDKYKNELLNFSINKKAGVKGGKQTVSYEYDSRLDRRLKEILIELQQILRFIFTKIRDLEDEGL